MVPDRLHLVLRGEWPTREGGSSIVKVPGDEPPTRVYFFGPLV